VAQLSTLGSIHAMNRYLALFIAASVGLCLLTGCASTVVFKAVDAATSQPLAEVRTIWRMDSRDYLDITTYHFGPTNLPPSMEDGIIVVGGIYKGKASRFIFSRDCYAPVYGIYYEDSMARADHIYPDIFKPPFDEHTWGFNIKAPVSYITPTNGVIIVRMSPQ
jgi:hypothetical protein